MTLFYSVRELLAQQQNSPQLPKNDQNGIIVSNHLIKLLDPKQRSQGYRCWMEFPSGIGLLVDEYTLEENLIVSTGGVGNGEPVIEFSFMVSGYNPSAKIYSGKNFIDTSHSQGIGADVHWQSNQHIAKIDVFINLNVYRQFSGQQMAILPSSIQKFIETEGITGIGSFYLGKNTPAMQMVLHQILHCPYQDLTRQIYLEGKCLELVALRLDAMKSASNDQIYHSRMLRQDDIDSIYAAKEILIRRFNNPPSLVELARLVGLNDYKLKIGFRQIFHTTVFQYLQTYRMEMARELLREHRMTVKEIAQMVGYASPSRFAEAFKKHFGVNPGVYLGK